MGEQKKKKSVADRLTYAYLRKIKKWMFCPACKDGRMVINKTSATWVCEDCGYQLAVREFEDDYVFWFCDECNTYLNNQEGFDRSASKHICRHCGYENDTTFDNLRGICSDCGKTVPDPDSTLCVRCKQERLRKAKIWVSAAGKVAGVAAAAAGMVYLAAKFGNEDHTSQPYEVEIDRVEGIMKDFICIRCGHTWLAMEDEDGLFNGYGVPRCPVCGDSGCNPNDYADYTCKYCGHQWRQYGNGGLVLGCIPRCPECGC